MPLSTGPAYDRRFCRQSQLRRNGGIWDYVSPSRLNLWLRCPLAFKLRYIDGVPTPSTPARFLGRMVHLGLEHWYRHRQFGLSLRADTVAAYLDEVWNQTVADEAMQFDTGEADDVCRRQAHGLLAAYLAQVPLDEGRPLAVETAVEAPLVDPLTGENLGLPLVGVMDLVLAEAHGPIVTDFKTAARSSDALEVIHEVQLTSYAYLFRHVSQTDEAGLEIRSLVKTKAPKIERHRYAAREERHFRRLFAVIRAYLDDLESSRFLYRPGLACSCCEYRCTGCQAWSG